MTDVQAEAITPAQYDLAEGIIWDDRTQVVRWINIRRGRVLAAPLDKRRLGDIESREITQTVGAVALAEEGGLLLSVARSLADISPAGELRIGPDLLGDRTDVRFNDGSVNPQGRFAAGTLSLVGDPGDDAEEVHFRVSEDGRVLDVVSVDAAQVSCPAFIGPDLDLLGIITAQEGLEVFDDRSGALFVANVAATGLPADRWPGSTTHPYWREPEKAGNNL